MYVNDFGIPFGQNAFRGGDQILFTVNVYDVYMYMRQLISRLNSIA